MLGPRREHDEVGAIEAFGQPLIERRFDRMRSEECPRAVRGHRAALRGRERAVHQENVGDPVHAPGIYDRFFGTKHSPVNVERHQMGVGPVGHVLDQPGRQSE